MHLKMNWIALALGAVLTACGGGGGSDSSSSRSVSVSSPIDPITGTPAAGNFTTAVSGIVYGAPTTGSIVTAFNVQPDGSNGALLGISRATGGDGRFSMTFNSTPNGMVRFVATEGFYISEADSTKQPVTAMDLVTPYVTTDLNFFAITPVTHIASHEFAYRASHGSTLTNAFNAAMSSVRSLGGGNLALANDLRASVNLLKTVPNSTDDTLHSYQDLLTGLEWFGVAYDLPSKEVLRIASSHAENSFPFDGVDGGGAPINVGQWTGSAFDASASRTMDQMMAIPQADPSGPVLHEVFRGYIATNMILDFYLDAACKNAGARQALFDRYPSFTAFFGSSAEAGGCMGVASRISALKAKKTTNHRSQMR